MNAMDDRNDLMMDVNLLNRNCVRHDRIPDVNSDVNHGRRTSDRLDDLRMNVTDDRKMDGNHVNRNCAPRDRKMGGNLDVKNLLLMYY